MALLAQHLKKKIKGGGKNHPNSRCVKLLKFGDHGVTEQYAIYLFAQIGFKSSTINIHNRNNPSDLRGKKIQSG